ncbi:hypothetical protein [Pedobacter sp. UBA5917]|jgi:hypothetical protein|uniref:hypothetical protein n=1 Tax=Pedobacter sp. UBA5917 TaxID=1947061 RepID=UPI0025D3D509|nr:hypothetical protein [Pedobacter sp. UBA5917]
MKKTLLTLILSFILFSAFGQSDYRKIHLDDTLLKVKNVLEKCLAGTNIRDLNTGFSIRQNELSNHYRFKGDVLNMLAKPKVKLIDSKVNKVLKKYRDIKLDGRIYFDRYLDSSLVDVGYHRLDTVYEFITEPKPLEPREGYSNFSKELHDIVKLKINKGKISKDSVFFGKKITFYVSRIGLITRDNQDGFNNELDSFFNAKRWKIDAHNGFPVAARVDLNLDARYLLDKDHWYGPAVTRHGYVDYGGNLATLDLIVPFKMSTETIFFSPVLPAQNWKYTSVVSMVYDDFFHEYRRAIVHFGSLEETDKLINDLCNSSFRNSLGVYNNRIYFYRMK